MNGLSRLVPPSARGPAVIALFGALFLLPFALSLGYDDEGLWAEVISAVHHARSLADGHYPFWNPFFGLGIPHPASQSLIHHPFLFAAGLLPLDWAIVALYGFQYLIALYGVWYLARRLDLEPWIALLVVLTYGMSAPAIEYAACKDFWPCVLVGWSLLPVVLLLGFRLVEQQDAAGERRAGLWLGIVLGLMVLNGHLGSAAVHLIGLATIVLGRPSWLWRRWQGFVTAGIVASIIGVGKVTDIATELALCPATDIRLQHTRFLDLEDLFLWPLNAESWRSAHPDFRDMLIGGPFALLWLIGLVAPAVPIRFRRELAIGSIAVLLLWRLPATVSPVFSTNWQLRDPLTLFAVLLAGGTLQWIHGQWRRGFAWSVSLAAAQVLVVCATLAPFWGRMLRDGLRSRGTDGVPVVRSSFRPRPFLDELERAGARRGERIYLSPWAEAYMGRSPALFDFAHFLPRDMRVINGVFKGVDAHACYPNRFQMTGWIEGSAAILGDKALLDRLNVGFVFALPRETVAPGLVPLGSYSFPWIPEPIQLFSNPDAWPEATFIDSPGESPSAAGALLTGQVTERVTRSMGTDRLEIRSEGTGLVLALDPSDQERDIFVSRMYRPDWRAVARGAEGTHHACRVRPVMGCLLRVTLPPGTTEIQLTYWPTARMVAAATSWLGLGGFAFAATALSARARQRRRTKAETSADPVVSAISASPLPRACA